MLSRRRNIWAQQWRFFTELILEHSEASLNNANEDLRKGNKDVEISGCRFRKFGKGLSDCNGANSGDLQHRDITQNDFLKIYCSQSLYM